jgi:hypothetical protein
MQDFDEWAQAQIAAILEHFGIDDYAPIPRRASHRSRVKQVY